MSPNPSRLVLLVDDEVDITESLRDLLEGSLADIRCQVATSGARALALMDEAPAALVISDFKMPGMNGLELLAQARRRHPDVPRVLMTAFPDLDVAIQAINEARVEAFLTKPLDPDKVVNLVHDIVHVRGAARR